MMLGITGAVNLGAQLPAHLNIGGDHTFPQPGGGVTYLAGGPCQVVPVIPTPPGAITYTASHTAAVTDTYFCPWQDAGTGGIGYTIIPANAPAGTTVITPQFNGCAISIWRNAAGDTLIAHEDREYITPNSLPALAGAPWSLADRITSVQYDGISLTDDIFRQPRPHNVPPNTIDAKTNIVLRKTAGGPNGGWEARKTQAYIAGGAYIVQPGRTGPVPPITEPPLNSTIGVPPPIRNYPHSMGVNWRNGSVGGIGGGNIPMNAHFLPNPNPAPAPVAPHRNFFSKIISKFL